MERTIVNPWSSSVNLAFDQAQLVEGHRRVLIYSGQDAVVRAARGRSSPGYLAAKPSPRLPAPRKLPLPPIAPAER
jgi:hypothetical protein